MTKQSLHLFDDFEFGRGGPIVGQVTSMRLDDSLHSATILNRVLITWSAISTMRMM